MIEAGPDTAVFEELNFDMDITCEYGSDGNPALFILDSLCPVCSVNPSPTVCHSCTEYVKRHNSIICDRCGFTGSYTEFKLRFIPL